MKEEVRRYYGSHISSFSGRGEMSTERRLVLRKLDPKVVDKWGIPVLRFSWE